MSLRSFLASSRAARLPVSRALVTAGRFDTRAIMAEAVKLARSINRSFGSWQARMSIGLRTVWGRAKAAMQTAAQAEPFPIRSEVNVHRQRPALARHSMSFTRGSRATSHGW